MKARTLTALRLGQATNDHYWIGMGGQLVAGTNIFFVFPPLTCAEFQIGAWYKRRAHGVPKVNDGYSARTAVQRR